MECGHPRLRNRRALLALALGAAVFEAVLLLGLGVHDPAIAVHASAPPPFGVFHDVRWLLVFHPSWLAFAVEATALVLVRGTVDALAIRLAWPTEDPPRLGRLFARTAIFTAGAAGLLVPWASFLFGLAVTPVSWLFLAGVVPVLLLGAVIHDGAITRPWWRRPTARTMGWTVLAFVVLSAGSAAVSLAPPWLVPVAVALTAWFNAWAWHSVVHAVVCDGVERRFPVVPIAVAVMLAVFIGVAALAFDVIIGGGAEGPYEPADAGDHPVLIANGFSSRWSGRQLDLLSRPYDEVQFSYRGLDDQGRPLPYDAGDTHRPLPQLAAEMARQVEVLHERTGQPVTVLAQSEGSLVARLFAASHDLAHVDRILLLSPLIEPGRVYYPRAGQDGWGVAAGWVLRGMTSLVALVSPYDADPDLPFIRSIVDHAPLLRPLPSCPVDGASTTMLVPLDTALAAPPDGAPTVDTVVVPAFHAGFLRPGATNRTVRAVLQGREPERSGLWARANRVGAAAAAGWHVPALPLSLVPAWAPELRATSTGPGGDPACGPLREAAGAWVRSSDAGTAEDPASREVTQGRP